MTRLLARELTIGARRPGLWLAAAVHAMLSLAFLYAWSETGRAPKFPGVTLYEQLSFIQYGFAILAAPWIAARLATPQRRSDVARMALLFAAPLPQLTRARVLATFVWIVLLCAAGVPAALMAQQMSSGATAGAMWIDQARLLGGASGAAALAIVVARRTDSPLAQWLTAATAAAILLTAVRWSVA